MERTGQETRGHDWAFMMGAGRCSSVVSPVIIWSARRTGTVAGISWTSKQRVSLRLGNVQSSHIPIFIPIFGKKWLVFIHAAAHRLLREKKRAVRHLIGRYSLSTSYFCIHIPRRPVAAERHQGGWTSASSNLPALPRSIGLCPKPSRRTPARSPNLRTSGHEVPLARHQVPTVYQTQVCAGVGKAHR
jgi:hypothetical protein